MAGSLAFAAVCQAVLDHLCAQTRPQPLAALDLRLAVGLPPNPPPAGQAGISLILYRTTSAAGLIRRNPPGRRDEPALPEGLPMELHFLLTPWAPEGFTQHALAGWAIQALFTLPILDAGHLNSAAPGCFRANETVQLLFENLSTEEIINIWQGLHLPYQLSLPYLARGVTIDWLS